MIIGLTGLAGSGKSTAASALENETGGYRLRFADGLKGMLRSLGCTEAEIEGQAKEMPSARLGGQTPRRAMQTLGTEWGRACMGEDFWVGLWSRRAVECLEVGCGVIAEDVRFPNEAAAVRALGGRVIRIERPSVALSEGCHPSESGLVSIVADAVVLNDGTPDDLLRRIFDALEGL